MAGKVCVVGYGPGVGHGVAQAFAGAGSDLALVARTPGKAEGLATGLRQPGRTVELIAADAGNEASLVGAIRGAEKAGPVEALVYNAVRFRAAPPTALAATDLVSDFTTNVAGARRRERGHPGDEGAEVRGRPLHRRRVGPLPLGRGRLAGRREGGAASLALVLAEELRGTGVRAGTVTIMGRVQPGAPVDPARIGAAVLRLATAPDAPAEVRFTGM